MQYPPCRNPSCSSHGQSHPNCKCYNTLSEGGATEFCARDNAHESDCQYFADGGAAAPDWNSLSATPPSEAASTSEEPSWDSLSPTPPSTSDAPDWDSLKSPEEHFGSTEQMIKTGLEGAAEGILSKPASIWAETHLLGVDPKNIAAREEANPVTHGLAEAGGLTAGLITGTGEAGLIGKAAEAIPLIGKAGEAGMLAKLGTSFLKGAIQSGAIQGGDEIGDAMLGKGDPEAPVASALTHIGAAGLLGGAVGAGTGLFNLALGKATPLLNSVSQDEVNSFAAGIGSEVNPNLKINLASLGSDDAESFSPKAFKVGTLAHKVVKNYVARAAVDFLPYREIRDKFPEGYLGDVAAMYAADQITHKLGLPAIKYVNKNVVMPAIVKVISNGETDLGPTRQWVAAISKGAKKVSDGVDALFKSGTQQAVELQSSERDRAKLNDFISRGGLNDQLSTSQASGSQSSDVVPTSPMNPGFARGGDVSATAGSDSLASNFLNKSDALNTTDARTNSYNMSSSPDKNIIHQDQSGSIDAISKHWPEQGMMLGAAKTRVNNYLNSVRPLPNQPKLAFDSAPDTREQEKTYNRALDIALQPLSVLDKIKKGTLTPEHLVHLNQMYPEVVSHLQKKITDRITQAQLKGEKPTYQVRQGLSMLMGTPLSGEMTSTNIQAAQAVFMQQKQQAQQAAPTKNKKGTASLSKAADSFKTADQAAAARQQGGH